MVYGTSSPSVVASTMGFGSLLEEVRKRWFLLGIICVISLAKLHPQLGAKEGGSIGWALIGTVGVLRSGPAGPRGYILPWLNASL